MALILISREEAIERVCKNLNFPWGVRDENVGLADSVGKRLAHDVAAACQSPEWTRSTRDGFAVRGADVCGASVSAPTFLSCVGEVKMGELPSFELGREACAKIHTGGILPNGADAVLMLEDAAETGGLVEARRAVQGGENIIRAGEEYKKGDTILRVGRSVDFAAASVLASMGMKSVCVSMPKIGILSTGDEVVEIDAPSAPGKIRDVNSWAISALLAQQGYHSEKFGIVVDDKLLLENTIAEMLQTCDVVLISGGSSVSERDHTEGALSSAGNIIVKGIRIVPGKPTIIAGSREKKRLLFGLPGHPLSCLTVMLTVVLPILNAMQTGVPSDCFTKLKLRTHGDVFGRTGVEEFIPCKLCDGEVVSMPSKSGYVGVLAEGFIRLPDNVETVRANEEVEVWLW